MISKIIQTIKWMALIYIPIWVSYFIYEVTNYHFAIGVYPRSFDKENILGIPGMWLSHGNRQHIMDNSIVMFPVLLFFLLIESTPGRKIISLLVASGFMTWLIGNTNSFNIGASAFIFSLYGYMIGTCCIYRPDIWKIRCLYMIPTMMALSYYGIGYFTNMFNGFMPHEGVSNLGHIGGFIAGIVVGYMYGKFDEKKSTIPALSC